ncbi:unnamed protein product, partial [Laminaria digitata]
PRLFSPLRISPGWQHRLRTGRSKLTHCARRAAGDLRARAREWLGKDKLRQHGPARPTSCTPTRPRPHARGQASFRLRKTHASPLDPVRARPCVAGSSRSSAGERRSLVGTVRACTIRGVPAIPRYGRRRMMVMMMMKMMMWIRGAFL